MRRVFATVPVLLATVIVLSTDPSASGAAMAGFDENHPVDRACIDTTRKMAKACRADTFDDYLTEFAKCLNTDEPRECRAEAAEELADARDECREQSGSRNELCRRLPDTGPYITDIDPADFKTPAETQMGGNQYFPLVIGTEWTYRNEEDNEDIVVTVTGDTREIEGVTTIVVRDVVSIDGVMIEDTDDYYAEDWNGNVWYFGEVAKNFENGFLTDLEGSFIAGEDGAQAGFIMLANPMPGDVYRQEFALGDAEDAAEVLALDANVAVANMDFACNNACLQTEDFVGNEADSAELKYYKIGVGVIAEQEPDGPVVLELISVVTPP